MSKGIGGIKGYHSGGGVTHTHGSKKNTLNMIQNVKG